MRQSLEFVSNHKPRKMITDLVTSYW